MNMNNPYVIEKLVKIKMEEAEREIQQDRLLQEAGISEASWLARLGNALLNLRMTKRKSLPNHGSAELQSYQPRRRKTAG